MESLFWTVMYKLQFWYIVLLHRSASFLMSRIVIITGEELTLQVLFEDDEEEVENGVNRGNGNIGSLVRVTPKSDLNYDIKGVILDEDDYLVKVELTNGETSTYHFENLEILEDA